MQFSVTEGEIARRTDIGILIFPLLTGWFIMPTLVAAQNFHPQTIAKAGPVSMHAEGTFEVKTSPLQADEAISGTAIGRYALDKQFHGDLEAASKGEMLGAGNPATGTAGYVAIEQVTGTLHGRAGSFALQHFGTMVDNKFELTVEVVPGSGTDALSGISGTMIIKIVSGKHTYQFDYELPSANG
jgi:hypothetical protein